MNRHKIEIGFKLINKWFTDWYMPINLCNGYYDHSNGCFYVRCASPSKPTDEYHTIYVFTLKSNEQEVHCHTSIKMRIDLESIL